MHYYIHYLYSQHTIKGINVSIKFSGDNARQPLPFTLYNMQISLEHRGAVLGCHLTVCTRSRTNILHCCRRMSLNLSLNRSHCRSLSHSRNSRGGARHQGEQRC